VISRFHRSVTSAEQHGGMTPRVVCAALVVFALLPVRPDAIVIRHDRPDARYRELGERFPAVSSFGRAGAGTLVGTQWVLTAAHVAAGLLRDATIQFKGTPYTIERIVVHPEWKEMGTKDIALVKLAAPVAGVEPMRVYDQGDEVGRDIIFVGNGGTGTGLTGPQTPEDGLKRGATNRIDSADQDWLYFTFDAPPGGTDLEGISGPGDSGGPAILQRDGVSFVVGVSVFGEPGAKGRGTYGAKEGYTRVSTHTGWIRGVMQIPNPRQKAAWGVGSWALAVESW
jgi:hypothetical protein